MSSFIIFVFVLTKRTIFFAFCTIECFNTNLHSLTVLRCQERNIKEIESVLLKFIDFFIQWWLLKESECLSANLALQKFFQTINFWFTQTTKRLQPVTTMGIFPPHAIKYQKIHEYSRRKWSTVSLFFTTSMANSSTELSASCSA